jgi:hypothetical protein
LPFHQTGGPVASLSGTLVRVPTDDGRCIWVADSMTTSSSATVTNPGFVVDPTAPFGTCPSSATFASGSPASIVHIETGDDPSLLVQIAQAYRLAGSTHVVFRMFRMDPGAPFGVTLLGGGVGRWDGSSGRIVVPGPDALSFSSDLSLGDAAVVHNGAAFVFGCPQPPMDLESGCLVTQLDAMDAPRLFEGAAGWVIHGRPSDAAFVLHSGPWVSSIVREGLGWLHVYASGFGTTLETHRATDLTGPWARGSALAACDLPRDDAHAFCAAPVVHEELADPTRPGERVISYGVGTMSSTRSTDPAAYWSRLEWVNAH